MRITRSRLTRDFLQVPNVTARDDRLTHMARGILVELLSRPDGWDATADDMWRASVKKHGKASPGRRQFRAAFAELKAYGYLAAEPAQLDGGQLGTVLTVRDVPAFLTGVPACGTSVPPGQTGNPADGTDVPACGTSVRPGDMDVFAGEADVPHAGTSYRKRSVENGGKKKTGGVADAVGNGAGGFASAGARDSAGRESDQDPGGSAASTTTTSSRPKTTKTRPRKTSPGFDIVRAAIPAAVAAPGTRLYPGLHRAIEDLLTGNPAAGIPSRTPEQIVARLNRRWYGENAEERAAGGYRGCERCTRAGCQAPRHSETTPEGCDRIKNPNAWLAAAILSQDCPDASCEDGQIIGGEACRACQERHAKRRAVTAASAKTANRWASETEYRDAVEAAVQTWADQEGAEEHRIRSTLGATGMHGVMLDHRVHQHMNGWREHHPRPESHPQKRQDPVQGAFLLALPNTSSEAAAAPQAPEQRGRKRTVVCQGCDKGHRTDTPDVPCTNCLKEATA